MNVSSPCPQTSTRCAAAMSLNMSKGLVSDAWLLWPDASTRCAHGQEGQTLPQGLRLALAMVAGLHALPTNIIT